MNHSHAKYSSILIENTEVDVKGKYRIHRGKYSFYVVGRGNYYKCSTLTEAKQKLHNLCIKRKNKRFKKKKKSKKMPKEVEIWYRRSKH
tara:strand:+ start:407 stop:673 length:267 start_codon:yes stop_codon:yes gene_type:complete